MSDLRSRIEALEQKHSGVARPALVLVEGRGGFSPSQLADAEAAKTAGKVVVFIERHDMSLRAPPEN